MPAEGDDWHYHIQHIGAQTRYIRASDPECNFITVYLEADTKSWGSWRKAEPTRDQKIKETVEYILSLFSKYNPHIELNSHSGGGNFIFGFMVMLMLCWTESHLSQRQEGPGTEPI